MVRYFSGCSLPQTAYHDLPLLNLLHVAWGGLHALLIIILVIALVPAIWPFPSLLDEIHPRQARRSAHGFPAVPRAKTHGAWQISKRLCLVGADLA